MRRRLAHLPAHAALCLLLAPLPLRGATPPNVVLPEVEGWTRAQEVRRFGRDTLYEHVDGASELFLSYGFRDLHVADYADGKGGSLVVEVYRHASPVHAFGIYSQERPREGRYLAIGVEAYLEPPMLNLLNRDAYVKLSADGLGSRTEDVLRHFAEAVVTALGGPGSAPGPLGLFPAEGKLPHSEAFAARDFLGYAFLRAGYSAEYQVGSQRFQMFVVDGGSAEDSAEMLRRYREATRLPAEAAASAPGEAYIVPDPYNGEVALFRAGRFLCGAVRLRDATLRERFLGALRRAVGEGR